MATIFEEELAQLRAENEALKRDNALLINALERSGTPLPDLEFPPKKKNGGSIDNGEKMKSVRASVSQHLEKCRSSLTATECSFIQTALKHASKDDLENLENNLQCNLTFFDPGKVTTTRSEITAASTTSSSETTKVNLRQSIGSNRRLGIVENRKQCQRRSKLWERASLKVVAINKFQRKILANDSESTKREQLAKESEDEEEEAIESAEENEAQERKRKVQADQRQVEVENSILSYSDQDEFAGGKDSSKHKLMVTRRASRNIYGGEGFEIGEELLFSMYAKPQPVYDPWEVDKDLNGHCFDFHIIGTSAHDDDCHPHVLSPPQMHALQSHLPFNVRGETFWLKYSLVRDGASKISLLQNIRGSQNTLMAMETVDGEVFGVFTAAPWHVQEHYFGTGNSFLWRMKGGGRGDNNNNRVGSLFEEARREADIDVFKYNFENTYEQLCQHSRLAAGGGSTPERRMVAGGKMVEPNDFGFGLLFDGDNLLEVSSSPCLTYGSPSLSEIHSDGAKMELLNLELWALTPCITLEEAQNMEHKQLFFKENARPVLHRYMTY